MTKPKGRTKFRSDYKSTSGVGVRQGVVWWEGENQPNKARAKREERQDIEEQMDDR